MLAQYAKQFHAMLCNWQSANNTFHSVKELNVRDGRKCLQEIKNIKLFSWEEGLLEIGPNRRRGCQLRLNKNVLQDIVLP